MDNRKHQSFDQRFLAPLKNRPDLEPDDSFVESLRTKIAEESSEKHTSIMPKWRWPTLLPMAIAVVLFSILTASFVGNNSNLEKSESADKAEEMELDKIEVKDTEERDIYKITANNQAFESIYRHLSKVTGGTTAGRELVYYFDALQKGDLEYLRNTLVFEYEENSAEQMIASYKNADFSTIEIEEVSPSEDNRLIVNFSYLNSETKEKIRSRLLIDMSDSKNMMIIDSAVLSTVDPEKDHLVNEKVEFIVSNFKLGMTEQEAAKLFGTEFKEYVNSDDEDGTSKEWLYNYYQEAGKVGTVENDSIVDFQNLKSQNIGIQFSIGWSADKKAMKMGLFYTQNGKVHVKGIKVDGTVIDEKQTTGEISLDRSRFELSETETAAYNWFKLEHDRDNLKDLSPLSIAKLYVQAELDGDGETQYALFTTRTDRIMWSKEEHLKFAKKEQVSKENILAAFQGLQNGEFVATSDFEGYIKFENANGTQGFQLVKDPDGIWKVAFMPIQ
jgi:hypothetical protein